MNILVTGAAGFIGSHLVDELLLANHRVVGIDNLSIGRVENLASALNSENFQFYNFDVRDKNTFENFGCNFDAILHLAALADIVPSIEKPREYFETNVDGTLNALEFARKNPLKKFIYIASSSCYGLPLEFPTSEKASIDPKYPYALTKYLGEALALHWSTVYRIPTISLRLFNVYGPRARTSGTYGAVFGTFLAQKLAGAPFTVVGDGTQTRDFTYVSDVVNAIITAMNSDIKGVFNVGSGKTNSINRLVELLGGEIIHIPKRPGEPDCTFADTGLIKQELGWSARISLEEGVSLMLKNLSDWADAPLWHPEAIEQATQNWFKYLG